MAISPNTTFTAGAIFTANQANAYPFGVCASSSSTTSYTLTTTVTIATGMSATFLPIANRLYRITYYEPQAGCTSTLSGFTALNIKSTNAAGTTLQTGLLQNTAAVASAGTLCVVHVGTFAAVSTVIVGCASTSSVTGAPVLTRSATQVARLIIEDIGPS